MTQPTMQLPTNYREHGVLDISRNRVAAIGLNLLAMLLFFIFGGVFIAFTGYVRGLEDLRLESKGLSEILLILGGVLTLIILQTIVHELIHGLFFWLFTRTPPIFGVGLTYAFAGAPDWYLPRNQHFIVGLAPLVLITFMGLLLLPVVPSVAVWPILLMMTANAAGAVGDMAMAVWLLFQPETALIRDVGDAITIYRRF